MYYNSGVVMLNLKSLADDSLNCTSHGTITITKLIFLGKRMLVVFRILHF